jgi:hypothetical protein
MVLEGAPGQGKSTLAQYVCQVHRMRLLNKKEQLEGIPEEYRTQPIRIPIKVDLRDYAVWLRKKDPFADKDGDSPPPGWKRSLESFLAHLISYQAGGADFSIADLHAVAHLSPLVVVLDGLDEVADVPRRRDLVKEVSEAANRLGAVAQSLQMIVTSRPAALANSPGFSERAFTYCELTQLTRPLIEEYTDRWIRARRLTQQEAADVRRVLKQRLHQPHLRDLARNPMQLAILLTLIYLRGSSLPDKRTALYFNYMQLFFDREAEKDTIVRDYRDLLIDIHGYLGWLLHSEAEAVGGRGSITAERLEAVLHSYLEQEGHDALPVEELFRGMVERVVALVSRVEGTFEFEVQPLREYFAARYLYDTAQYSPAGEEKAGSLPDRFDAIARNFYWLNVARFYAGSFSKGESPSLVDRLQVLADEAGWRLTNHPRALAAMFLSDWVFAQTPRSMRQVVALILDGLGLRHMLISGGAPGSRGTPLALPEGSGRAEVRDYCLDLLRSDQPADYAMEVIKLLRANSNTPDLFLTWLTETTAHQNDERTKWIKYGLWMGVLNRASFSQLDSLLADEPRNSERLALLLQAHQDRYCEARPDVANNCTESILDGKIWVGPRGGRMSSALSGLVFIVTPLSYGPAFRPEWRYPFHELWSHFVDPESLQRSIRPTAQAPEAADAILKARRSLEIFVEQASIGAKQWGVSLEPWDNLIEGLRAEWGERWTPCALSVIASAIRSQEHDGSDYSDLFDHSRSLCRRARYGRLRAGVPSWWSEQLGKAQDTLERVFALSLLMTWASERSLLHLSSEIDDMLNKLDHSDYARIYGLVDQVAWITGRNYFRNWSSVSLPGNLRKLSARFVAILCNRLRGQEALELYRKYLQKYSGDEPVIAELCLESELGLTAKSSARWNQLAQVASRAYANSKRVSDRLMSVSFSRDENVAAMPEELARDIAENARNYPYQLVAQAEARCRQALEASIVPVAQVAHQDKWFRMQ